MNSILEPLTHANLSVFLLRIPFHPPRVPKGYRAPRQFLSLAQALTHGHARVHETGIVERLEVENLSPEQDLFIQAGDIVEGGSQDRTFPSDLIIPARSGRTRVHAFCVEKGRWSQGRYGEEPLAFRPSDHPLGSRAMQLALRRQRSQHVLWEEIERFRDWLDARLGVATRKGDLTASQSRPLDIPLVQERLGECITRFAHLPEEHSHVTGAVFAIGGRLWSAELYATGGLFRACWPRLLRGAAVEALIALENGEGEPAPENVSLPDRGTVTTWLAATQRRGARRVIREVSERVTQITRETEEQISFETLDSAQGGLCVHQSILSLV